MNTQSNAAATLITQKSYLYKVVSTDSQFDSSLQHPEHSSDRMLKPSHQANGKTRQIAHSYFLDQIRELIETNMDNEDYGIEQLCREAGASRTQLHNKIKKLTGLSTSHYIRSIKLRKAKHLLLKTDLNISQISYEVGIKYPCYFSRIFEQSVGMCPKKFRQAWS